MQGALALVTLDAAHASATQGEQAASDMARIRGERHIGGEQPAALERQHGVGQTGDAL